METTPIALRDVLARIESQNDLGKTSWYEVVYHNGEKWCSCAESNTFSTLGDNVVDWVYCDEVLPRHKKPIIGTLSDVYHTKPKVADLVDALQDPIHRDIGNSRPAKTIKI